ncbi:hypothetical protein Mapa_007004 [Marchantia paleacea]|nr:hypothetical protein Mapa_007004 [Marchantia paleacea]
MADFLSQPEARHDQPPPTRSIRIPLGNGISGNRKWSWRRRSQDSATTRPPSPMKERKEGRPHLSLPRSLSSA